MILYKAYASIILRTAVQWTDRVQDHLEFDIWLTEFLLAS